LKSSVYRLVSGELFVWFQDGIALSATGELV
jgi:hypothetical protein